jgi:hypothetical protein
MSTYDPNNRYKPTDAGDSYSGWVIGGLVAIAIVIGLIFWGASGDNGSQQTASTPAPQSQTTGMGSPSTPARPSANPKTPAPPAPVGQVR